MTEESRFEGGWFQEFTLEEMRQQEVKRRERWSEMVHINPAASVLVRLTRKATYGDLRGLLHGGDLYWWDSLYGTHNDAMNWMKIAGGQRPQGEVEMHVAEDGSIGFVSFDHATWVSALAHPSLSGHVDPEGILTIKATGGV